MTPTGQQGTILSLVEISNRDKRYLSALHWFLDFRSGIISFIGPRSNGGRDKCVGPKTCSVVVKREMSLGEKNMLRLGLESLPEDKMHNMLRIVRKKNNNQEMLGDEIKLDIDEMDVERVGA